MSKEIIKQIEDKKIVHHFGMTRFTGCQCFKDCTCHNDFKSEPYNYYTVTRNIGTRKQKTTLHNTIEEAEQRWKFILSL